MRKAKILVAGSSGLIGSVLVPFLQAQGFIVGRLLRQPQNDHPFWDINNNILHLKEFSNPDIIINLAGENIASGRWTKQKKQQFIDSRILSTQLLVKHFQEMPPKLLINASAIGFYGDRGLQRLDESDSAGHDFVSRLALQWEQSSQAIKKFGTRLVNLRTGIVLSQKGGALAKMLPAFKFGLGGKIGSGNQIMSWIDINDLLMAILFIIHNPYIEGPVNMVSPNSVSNQEFTRLLAKQLHRPSFLPLPEFLIRLLFAEMGEELLLASTNVFPKKLIDLGFEFEYATLEKSFLKQLG